MRKNLIFIIESQYEAIKTVRIWNARNILSPDCFSYMSDEPKSMFERELGDCRKSLKNKKKRLRLYLKYGNIE